MQLRAATCLPSAVSPGTPTKEGLRPRRVVTTLRIYLALRRSDILEETYSLHKGLQRRDSSHAYLWEMVDSGFPVTNSATHRFSYKTKQKPPILFAVILPPAGKRQSGLASNQNVSLHGIH